MTDTSGTAHFKFLSTVHEAPAELAPLIQVYHLPSSQHSSTRGQSGLWDLFLQCLPLMVNLKELAFHNIIGSPSRILPSLEEGCQAPFQLDKFSWTQENPKCLNRKAYEAQALSLLETQHELTQLRWVSRSKLISKLPVGACPKLKRLEGSTNAIGAILPSRSVTELHWLRPWWFHNRLSIQEKVMNLTELRALCAISLETYAHLQVKLQTLDTNPRNPFSNIEVVEVCIIYDKDVIPPDYPAVLSRFHRLKKLVITTPKGKARYRAVYDPSSQISQLFAYFPHLKYVDFFVHPAYRRWVDGVLLKERVSIDRDRILQLE
ncbi:hypothetical protein GALMADRAFT_242245 [Galerina marginata CBS 339.88]|uniref:F-box domain-containing protein n=1 Tax=Galerina marginata (strain CBS 339.88) TaxID=685588 RepID=A0A067TCH0_GALM3|nr:hypothetical protein GALMADRAFT_242245 [Galerina marginata CBS 339.88]